MISTEYILLHWNELKDYLGQLVCLQEVNLQRWQGVNFQPSVSTPSTIWVNSLLCRSYLFNAWIWNRPLTHFQNVILHSLIFLSDKFSFQESQPLRNSTPCVPSHWHKSTLKKRKGCLQKNYQSISNVAHTLSTKKNATKPVTSSKMKMTVKDPMN